MKICYMPMYCGGRFLIGLYDQLRSDHPSYQEGKMYYDKFNTDRVDMSNFYGQKGDPYPYLPGSLELFQHCLKKALGTNSTREGYQGVVTAVTNGSQKMAVKYLEASGFKVQGKYSKYADEYSSKCIFWVGDYLNDIYPILNKVPNYRFETEEKKNATRKFSSASTDTIRNS